MVAFIILLAFKASGSTSYQRKCLVSCFRTEIKIWSWNKVEVFCLNAMIGKSTTWQSSRLVPSKLMRFHLHEFHSDEEDTAVPRRGKTRFWAAAPTYSILPPFAFFFLFYRSLCSVSPSSSSPRPVVPFSIYLLFLSLRTTFFRFFPRLHVSDRPHFHIVSSWNES